MIGQPVETDISPSPERVVVAGAMSKPVVEPLRGEAAWRAAKKGVAERNEEAFARGRKERTTRDNAQIARRVAQEREADRSLPRQPTH